MPSPEERVSIRRKKLLNLRRGSRNGVFGLTYGMSAFGYPLGAIAGVQTPDLPVSPDQFGGVAPDASTASDSGSDSGGAP